MDFVVKWELMSNKLLVCLHFLRQSFTEDSGFCSETIAFIYFKLCIYVYQPIYFRIYLFAFRLTWISICVLHLLLICHFFMCKELRFQLTGNKMIIIILLIIIIIVIIMIIIMIMIMIIIIIIIIIIVVVVVNNGVL